MGNKESNSNNEGVPLDQFLASQQFRSNMQNVYSQNANIPAYPGAYLDNEHAEVLDFTFPFLFLSIRLMERKTFP